MATTAKATQLKAEIETVKDQIAQIIGGPEGIQLANAIETVIGKALELFAEEALPVFLKPVLSGAIAHFGDELIATAEAATDKGLAKLAADNQVPPAT